MESAWSPASWSVASKPKDKYMAWMLFNSHNVDSNVDELSHTSSAHPYTDQRLARRPSGSRFFLRSNFLLTDRCSRLCKRQLGSKHGPCMKHAMVVQVQASMPRRERQPNLLLLAGVRSLFASRRRGGKKMSPKSTCTQ